MHRPWHFVEDPNFDGQFTISDIWTLLGQLFFMPGNSIIYYVTVEKPHIAASLAISLDDYGGFLSGVLSVINWMAAIFFIGASFVNYDAWKFRRRLKKLEAASKDEEKRV